MFSFICFLLCILIGQVDIAPGNLVYNKSGSQCVWATLETQARHWGMVQLYDLTAKYKYATGPQEAEAVMRSRGVHVFWMPCGYHHWDSLENAMARHWPTSVGINGNHMILVVDVTKDSVKVIDNCGKEALKIQTWPRKWFDSQWDGWQCTIDPEFRPVRIGTLAQR